MWAVFSVAPCLYGVCVSQCFSHDGVAVSEQQEPNRAVMREGEDDPSVWVEVSAFEKAQTADTTKKAIGLLDEKLQNWDAHPAEVIVSILEVIGKHHIREARPQVLRFLHVDEHLKEARYIGDRAAVVLADLGGADAFEELERRARQASDDSLTSIAVAMGVLGDRRSVPILEDFASRSNADLRARSLSALANYCSPTSRDEAMRALRDEDERVRNSGVSWLSRCGGSRDAQVLMERLEDVSALVRMNALKGMTRIGSSAACKRIDHLMQDPDPSVREVASGYSRLCASH